jgi:hypothetical protein
MRHFDEARQSALDAVRKPVSEAPDGWLRPLADPPWASEVEAEREGPPVVVWYSFKGGVGRSTAVAAFALSRARLGERVAVVDADLDAPGVGLLLDPSAAVRWGVVDYLLERPHGEVDLRDYYHGYGDVEATGEGEILVVPAGRLNGDYLGKLARLDTEPVPPRRAVIRSNCCWRRCAASSVPNGSWSTPGPVSPSRPGCCSAASPTCTCSSVPSRNRAGRDCGW